MAYAMEQTYVESQRRIKWEQIWAKLRVKGEEVLEKKLKGEEIDLEDISVEIEAAVDDNDKVGSIYSVSDDEL
jgi:hypothetical protein